MAERDLSNRVDLTLKRGCQFAAAFVEFLDRDDAAVDLTGATATANFYAGTPEAPGSLAYAVTSGNGKLVIDAAAGSVAFALTPTHVAEAAAAGAAWYEFLLTLPGALGPDEVAWGSLTFDPTGASP